MEDLVTDSEINEGRQEDAYPDGHVVCEYPERTPIIVNPTPKLMEEMCISEPFEVCKAAFRSPEDGLDE